MANEDEANLLATLGSTTTEASHYESSILRDAQLSTAPQILLPPSAFNVPSSTSSLVPCHSPLTFPELASLAPSTERKSGNASADIPHVLKILSRTRDALSVTQNKPPSAFDGQNDEARQSNKRREIDILCMKEQILLSYLTTVAGLDEKDELIPQKRGRKRAREESAADVYYGTGNEQAAAANTEKGTNNSHKASATTNTEPSTNRLDRIKNGENIDASNTNGEATKPRRRTMMQMKSDMRIESGLTPLKSMEEERFDAERSRKRREERKKRRLRKQKMALGLDDDASDVLQTDAVAADSTKKADFKTVSILKRKDSGAVDDTSTNNDGAESSKKNGVCWDENVKADSVKSDASKLDLQSANENNAVCWGHDVKNGNGTTTSDESKPDTHAAVKRTHTKVMCPVCQIILTCEEKDGAPDEFLSKHIEQCQQSRSRGGRTLRRRTKPTVVDTDDDLYEEFNTEPTEPIKSVAVEEKLFDDDVHESAQKAPAYDQSKSIDDIDEFDYEDRVDDWIEHGIDRMRDMSERDSTEVPPGAVTFEGGLEVPAWINDRLFPYQRTGVRWMWELHCQGAGGVVGDEMGLGKTVQVASFVGAMAANRFLDSVLIIAPATMLSHWLSELAVWAPGLRRIMVHRSGESDGVSRVVSRGMLRSLQKWLKKARADRVHEAIDDKDFDEQGPNAFCGTGYAVVTTYESIRRSPDVWISHEWSYVVLDEGQKIRNPDADVTLACKRLRTPNRLLMSGTPIQNDLRELWSLFDFIFPGRLGTLPAFEAEFADPIKRGGYSNASPMAVQLAYRCALVLRDLINPYLLRRQKKDIKEVNRMPSKTEQVLFCRLSSKQRSLYQEYLASDEVMGVMRGSVQLLKAVTTLRKICNHPDLVVGPDGALDSAFKEESFSDEDDFDVLDEDQLAERAGKLHVLSKILVRSCKYHSESNDLHSRLLLTILYN
jgi:SNF2 family DNA or RNA helicase